METVKKMPDELENIYRARTFTSVRDIYHTGFMQLIFSGLLTFFLLFIYNLFHLLSGIGVLAKPVKSLQKSMRSYFK